MCFEDRDSITIYVLHILNITNFKNKFWLSFFIVSRYYLIWNFNYIPISTVEYKCDSNSENVLHYYIWPYS